MINLQALFVCLATLASVSTSFQIPHAQRGTQNAATSTTILLASSSADRGAPSTVISPDDIDFEFDTGSGGVRLAKESAIKLTGSVKTNKNTSSGAAATVGFKSLIRYFGLVEVSDSEVEEQLKKVGATVVCTGRGQELYKDPGQTTESVVILGPIQAAEEALKGTKTAPSADEVIVNILGGDDLQFLEVKEALEVLVPELGIGNAKVRFNSLCHASIDLGSVTITAVALPAEASSNGLSGVNKAIADGEVYFRDGKWYTVIDEDINPAEE